ncbi:LacI family DNA-binding transcriptional regulator [Candidatus Enterococcus ferrettii]|uniref:HTH lacI-type domain-containing protein n=1 Tax=Candidatus Enterococcus ferrettii TaxID=2815324 RepID=A0ABV0ENR5_9ENTE|nr:LacI family DNA-binding transcriptional regulator [Enterococcus sp. 665A]MBO1340899.1 LacI family DNA-binding transcriptional regulator [Enterococcus sp. 665A]
MANIRDIAKLAGVSLSTLSRVINQEKYVSDEKRKLVQEAIEKTSYTRNGNAVKLSTEKSGIIGVQIPYNNSCYDQLIDSILLATKEKSYQVQLLPTYYEQETENYYYSMLEQNLIDGLILTSRTPHLINWPRLLAKGKLVSTEKLETTEVPMIYADREQVYDQLFSQLHAKKVKDVVFVAKRDADQSIATRNKMKAFEHYFGKAEEGQNYFVGIDDYESGYAWAKKQAAVGKIPAYVYANGDSTAAGILAAFQEAGFQLKKDFCLIGEGHSSYSKLLNFSTIDFSSREISQDCVDFLLSDQQQICCRKEARLILR